MSSYFRVRIYKVTSQLEDLITTLSFEHAATGVSEALMYTQPDLTYDPDIVPLKFHDIDVYFPEKPEAEFFERLKALDSRLTWETLEEENKDWLAEWKKGFVPFNLAGGYWVVPSWLPSPVDTEHALLIDPGMAFGTGTHATTKMASSFLIKVAKELPDRQELTLLDVGTGTAILAMLAHRLGFGLVAGIEIDPEARRVARENIKLNKLDDIDIREQLLEEVDDTFDVVIANIIDGVLIKIKDDLFRVLNPGGHLFLTGILLEREDHFFENFIEGSGLTVVRRLEKDEWIGYWLQS
jgi:ribosomal protein L11 methyltransferase